MDQIAKLDVTVEQVNGDFDGVLSLVRQVLPKWTGKELKAEVRDGDQFVFN